MQEDKDKKRTKEKKTPKKGKKKESKEKKEKQDNKLNDASQQSQKSKSRSRSKDKGKHKQEAGKPIFDSSQKNTGKKLTGPPKKKLSKSKLSKNAKKIGSKNAVGKTIQDPTDPHTASTQMSELLDALNAATDRMFEEEKTRNKQDKIKSKVSGKTKTKSKHSKIKASKSSEAKVVTDTTSGESLATKDSSTKKSKKGPQSVKKRPKSALKVVSRQGKKVKSATKLVSEENLRTELTQKSVAIDDKLQKSAGQGFFLDVEEVLKQEAAAKPTKQKEVRAKKVKSKQKSAKKSSKRDDNIRKKTLKEKKQKKKSSRQEILFPTKVQPIEMIKTEPTQESEAHTLKTAKHQTEMTAISGIPGTSNETVQEVKVVKEKKQKKSKPKNHAKLNKPVDDPNEWSELNSMGSKNKQKSVKQATKPKKTTASKTKKSKKAQKVAKTSKKILIEKEIPSEPTQDSELPSELILPAPKAEPKKLGKKVKSKGKLKTKTKTQKTGKKSKSKKVTKTKSKTKSATKVKKSGKKTSKTKLTSELMVPEGEVASEPTQKSDDDMNAKLPAETKPKKSKSKSVKQKAKSKTSKVSKKGKSIKKQTSKLVPLPKSKSKSKKLAKRKSKEFASQQQIEELLTDPTQNSDPTLERRPSDDPFRIEPQFIQRSTTKKSSKKSDKSKDKKPRSDKGKGPKRIPIQSKTPESLVPVTTTDISEASMKGKKSSTKARLGHRPRLGESSRDIYAPRGDKHTKGQKSHRRSVPKHAVNLPTKVGSVASDINPNSELVKQILLSKEAASDKQQDSSLLAPISEKLTQKETEPETTTVPEFGDFNQVPIVMSSSSRADSPKSHENERRSDFNYAATPNMAGLIQVSSRIGKAFSLPPVLKKSDMEPQDTSTSDYANLPEGGKEVARIVPLRKPPSPTNSEPRSEYAGKQPRQLTKHIDFSKQILQKLPQQEIAIPEEEYAPIGGDTTSRLTEPPTQIPKIIINVEPRFNPEQWAPIRHSREDNEESMEEDMVEVPTTTPLPPKKWVPIPSDSELKTTIVRENVDVVPTDETFTLIKKPDPKKVHETWVPIPKKPVKEKLPRILEDDAMVNYEPIKKPVKQSEKFSATNEQQIRRKPKELAQRPIGNQLPSVDSNPLIQSNSGTLLPRNPTPDEDGETFVQVEEEPTSFNATLMGIDEINHDHTNRKKKPSRLVPNTADDTVGEVSDDELSESDSVRRPSKESRGLKSETLSEGTSFTSSEATSSGNRDQPEEDTEHTDTTDVPVPTLATSSKHPSKSAVVTTESDDRLDDATEISEGPYLRVNTLRKLQIETESEDTTANELTTSPVEELTDSQLQSEKTSGSESKTEPESTTSQEISQRSARTEETTEVSDEKPKTSSRGITQLIPSFLSKISKLRNDHKILASTLFKSSVQEAEDVTAISDTSTARSSSAEPSGKQQPKMTSSTHHKSIKKILPVVLQADPNEDVTVVSEVSTTSTEKTEEPSVRPAKPQKTEKKTPIPMNKVDQSINGKAEPVKKKLPLKPTAQSEVGNEAREETTQRMQSIQQKIHRGPKNVVHVFKKIQKKKEITEYTQDDAEMTLMGVSEIHHDQVTHPKQKLFQKPQKPERKEAKKGPENKAKDTTIERASETPYRLKMGTTLQKISEVFTPDEKTDRTASEQISQQLKKLRKVYEKIEKRQMDLEVSQKTEEGTERTHQTERMSKTPDHRSHVQKIVTTTPPKPEKSPKKQKVSGPEAEAFQITEEATEATHATEKIVPKPVVKKEAQKSRKTKKEKDDARRKKMDSERSEITEQDTEVTDRTEQSVKHKPSKKTVKGSPKNKRSQKKDKHSAKQKKIESEASERTEEATEVTDKTEQRAPKAIKKPRDKKKAVKKTPKKKSKSKKSEAEASERTEQQTEVTDKSEQAPTSKSKKHKKSLKKKAKSKKSESEASQKTEEQTEVTDISVRGTSSESKKKKKTRRNKMNSKKEQGVPPVKEPDDPADVTQLSERYQTLPKLSKTQEDIMATKIAKELGKVVDEKVKQILQEKAEKIESKPEKKIEIEAKSEVSQKSIHGERSEKSSRKKGKRKKRRSKKEKESPKAEESIEKVGQTKLQAAVSAKLEQIVEKTKAIAEQQGKELSNQKKIYSKIKDYMAKRELQKLKEELTQLDTLEKEETPKPVINKSKLRKAEPIYHTIPSMNTKDDEEPSVILGRTKNRIKAYAKITSQLTEQSKGKQKSPEWNICLDRLETAIALEYNLPSHQESQIIKTLFPDFELTNKDCVNILSKIEDLQVMQWGDATLCYDQLWKIWLRNDALPVRANEFSNIIRPHLISGRRPFSHKKRIGA